MISASPIVFLDTETDGTHPDRQAWEVAMIRRDAAGERRIEFFVEIDLRTANPHGLRIGGFYGRHPQGRYLSGVDEEPSEPWDPNNAWHPKIAAREVARWTHGAMLVGAVPDFDARALENLLRGNGLIPAWSHQLRCVEAITAGHLGREIGGLSACAEALGIEHTDRHTAMGDTLAAMAIWDRIITKDSSNDHA